MQVEGYANLSIVKNVVGLVGDIVSVYQASEVVKARAPANHIE